MNYANLVIPSVLEGTDINRLAELVSCISPDDANDQLRIALYLAGKIDKRTDFKHAIYNDDPIFTNNISNDSDYRNRVANFVSYNFITDEVTYTISGGEIRHCFKTQEEADKWIASGKSNYHDWTWSPSSDFPIIAWRPVTETTGEYHLKADLWP